MTRAITVRLDEADHLELSKQVERRPVADAVTLVDDVRADLGAERSRQEPG